MNKRLTTVLSLLVLFSMVLSACTAATTQAPPAATSAPAATDTVAPQPTNTAPPAATAAPTNTPAPTTPPKSTRTGGLLDQVVFTKIEDPQGAVAQLQAGAIDVYPVTVSDPDVYNTVKGDKNLSYNLQYGGSDQMILNTVPCTDKNTLNPFTDAKIREAMNWAVDRNYIAQEIAGGLAIPRYTGIDDASSDAARYAADLASIVTKYGYNLDKAKAVVDAEMPTLGATKDANGKWQFNGKPVTIIGLIRTEDSRKQMGIYFAQQLEKLGFTVDQQLKTRKEAAPIWQGDPAPCKFGYYTAGWISTAITRDEGYNFAQFNSGQVQNIPLFLKYAPSKELQTAEDALLNNTFTTLDQRDQYFHTAFQLSMQESWWGVWLVTNVAFTPFSNKIQGASDLYGGFSTTLFPYTAKFAAKEGGSLRVAQSGILVQAWNPIQGSNWVDDAIPQNFTEDHGVIPNPYTGLMMPKLVQKMDVVVKSGLPVNKSADSTWVTLTNQDSIAVPDDAWADWNAKTQTFVSAKDRAAADKNYKQTANVQITVTYTPDLFKTKWHDGSNFDVSDVVMGMIMYFDPGKPESKIYDKGYAESSFAANMSHFKGVKIVSTNPLTITTWDDKFQLDAENNAQVGTWYPAYGGNGSGDAYTYGTGAWDNIALGVAAEADGKMAFSLDKSSTLKVDETSLISGPTLAIQATYLDKFAASGEVPFAPTMSKYVSADQAKARYASLQAFYKAHNHMWIGTGPYFVDKVDTTGGSLTLTRFTDYPFPADQFAGFSAAEIAAATVDGPTQVKAGDDAPFTVTVKFNDQPYPSKDIDKVGYTLFGSDGSVVASGAAKMTAEGSYAIDLAPDVTTKLPAGSASLSVAVASKVVALPTFVTYQFVVTQ